MQANTEQQKIGWGILGTSPISEVMAKAIHGAAGCELIAIASRSKDRAENFANKYSIRKYYDSQDALLADPEIDAIYIGLPNHLHKEWIIRCASMNKHVLCEKPFVLNEEEAIHAINAAHVANIVCMEALMYRYHPFIAKLRNIITDGTIGKIKLIHAVYTAHITDVANPIAGGSIRNLGCYPISLVRLLLNADPISTSALGRMNTSHPLDSQATIMMKFANDVIAVVSTADDIKMSWQFEVYGTDGQLKVITNPWLPSEKDNLISIVTNNGQTEIIKVDADKPLYVYQIEALNKQIIQKHARDHFDVALSDSLANTKILQAWIAALQN